MSEIDPIGVVSDLVHDARGSIGSVRLAITTLQEIGGNEELRAQLLQSADDESARLVTRLSALTPLVACLLDDSPSGPVAVAPVVEAAACLARRLGAIVRVEEIPAMSAWARPSIERGLGGMMGVVAGPTGRVSVGAAPGSDGPRISLGSAFVLDRGDRTLIEHLAIAIGARVMVIDGATHVDLPGPPR